MALGLQGLGSGAWLTGVYMWLVCYVPYVCQVAVYTRDCLLKLGPTFIKFGQLLSTRSGTAPIIITTSSTSNSMPRRALILEAPLRSCHE